MSLDDSAETARRLLRILEQHLASADQQSLPDSLRRSHLARAKPIVETINNILEDALENL
jgi:hypothetical protein